MYVRVTSGEVNKVGVYFVVSVVKTRRVSVTKVNWCQTDCTLCKTQIRFLRSDNPFLPRKDPNNLH